MPSWGGCSQTWRGCCCPEVLTLACSVWRSPLFHSLLVQPQVCLTVARYERVVLQTHWKAGRSSCRSSMCLGQWLGPQLCWTPGLHAMCCRARVGPGQYQELVLGVDG